MSENLLFDAEPFTPPTLESVRTRERAERRSARKKLGRRVISVLGFKNAAQEKTSEIEAPTDPFERQKATWAESITGAVGEGWLDRSVLDRLPTLDQHKIHVAPEGTLNNDYTVGQVKDGIVTLAEGHEDALGHELNHLVLQGTAQYATSGESITFRRFVAPWINEALTEHISETLDGRASVEQINTSGNYLSQRALLQTLIDRFNDPEGPDKDSLMYGISLTDLTRDYSTGRGASSGRIDDFKDLTVRIDRIINDEAFIESKTGEERVEIDNVVSFQLFASLLVNKGMSVNEVLDDYSAKVRAL